MGGERCGSGGGSVVGAGLEFPASSLLTAAARAQFSHNAQLPQASVLSQGTPFSQQASALSQGASLSQQASALSQGASLSQHAPALAPQLLMAQSQDAASIAAIHQHLQQQLVCWAFHIYSASIV